jgi:D-alanyl-D-alanine dipeptidase
VGATSDRGLHWLSVPDPHIAALLPADLPPIPPAPGDAEVEAIAVAEDGTELQDLPAALAQRHGYREISSLRLTPPRIRLRREVVARLEQAQAALPEGIALLILDGWRPPRFQQELLAHYRSETGRDLDGFVSDPGHAHLIAPHTTGGAIDLTLRVGEAALAMGTDWDSFRDESALRHLERDGAVRTAEDSLARDLRRLLASVLLDAGFAPLPSEWWHWSYGDQRWAAFHGESATLYAPTDDDGVPARGR